MVIPGPVPKLKRPTHVSDLRLTGSNILTTSWQLDHCQLLLVVLLKRGMGGLEDLGLFDGECFDICRRICGSAFAYRQFGEDNIPAMTSASYWRVRYSFLLKRSASILIPLPVEHLL